MRNLSYFCNLPWGILIAKNWGILLSTYSELAKRFDVHPQMISNWKREFIARSSEIFSTKAPDEEAAKREKALYEKIGRLEVEVDFCKRASEQLGILKSSKKSSR